LYGNKKYTELVQVSLKNGNFKTAVRKIVFRDSELLVLFVTLDTECTARNISECNKIIQSWRAGKEEDEEEIEIWN